MSDAQIQDVKTIDELVGALVKDFRACAKSITFRVDLATAVAQLLQAKAQIGISLTPQGTANEYGTDWKEGGGVKIFKAAPAPSK